MLRERERDSIVSFLVVTNPKFYFYSFQSIFREREREGGRGRGRERERASIFSFLVVTNPRFYFYSFQSIFRYVI